MTKQKITTANSSAQPQTTGEFLRPFRRPHPYEQYVGAKAITLATLLKRSSAIRNNRLLNLSMVESRVILRIGTSEPLSLDELAEHVAISKSQTSRTVKKLVENGLVLSKKDQVDKRGIEIRLTKKGRAIEGKMKEAAFARHLQLSEEFDSDQLESLSQMLDQMIVRARALLQDDQKLSCSSESTVDEFAGPDTDEG